VNTACFNKQIYTVYSSLRDDKSPGKILFQITKTRTKFRIEAPNIEQKKASVAELQSEKKNGSHICLSCAFEWKVPRVRI
jgi:hypothetical protein